MKILVTGATGYIGGRLVPRLLEAGHTVRCIIREKQQLAARFGDQIEIVEGDVLDPDAVRRALDGMDAAYYLIHSMSAGGHDFAETDRKAATIFANAAAEARVERIIYLGGLGDSRKKLSKHLRSRQEVGMLLAGTGVAVTEFRAAVIVGAGSASFEMLRNLTERLPVMIAPRWVKTRCQPIWIVDVIAYLLHALDRPEAGHHIYEIGGRDVLSYYEMMMRYAKIRKIDRAILIVPLLTPTLSSYWVNLVTPLPRSLARALIDGLSNEVIVHDDEALRAFPITPAGYDDAVTRALDRSTGDGPETTWFDALTVRSLPGEFTGVAQGMLIDRRVRRTGASKANLDHVYTSLGGERGWLYADSLWEIRGIMDRFVGGYGTRRGRRSATSLRVGDAIDFWRVEAYEQNRLLRLSAEMKLPGTAWLQFEACDGENGTTLLRQTAFFEPKGLLGHAYWLSVMPFHHIIFGNMATRIVECAEQIA